LQQWLPQALALTQRAQHAILLEYGQNVTTNDNDNYLFNLTMLERPGQSWGTKKEPLGNAGFATESTLAQIRKRLLHSIVTEGTFIFAMGGHSAAAGHGNHFVQSYTLQVQRLLEPVLARLGVHHRAHNYGMGGLGTIQNALAARTMYGHNIDILMWDSGMTEGRHAEALDLFARQGLLSGDTVPVLWNEPDGARYGAGAIATGELAVRMPLDATTAPADLTMPITENAVQVETLPYATRYLNCDHEAVQLCKSRRFNATCWVEREDGLVPPKPQKPKPGGQASWHHGNRK